MDTCISVWHWPTHERWYDEGMRNTLRRTKAAGFTHINWNADAGYSYVYAPSEMDHIASMIEEAGLKVWSLHGSHGKNTVSEVGQGMTESRKDFLSPHEWQRQAGLDLIRNRIALAKRIGSPNVVMHFDIDDDVFVDQDAKEAYFEVLHRSLDDLRDDCEASGVRIAIENLPRFTFAHTMEQFERVFERHPETVIGMCYDSGHSEISEKSGTSLLESFGQRLIATHMNDNRSVRDDHLLPGDGNIDWQRIVKLIAALPYQLPLTWETPYLTHGMGYHMGEASFLNKAQPEIARIEQMVLDLRSAREPDRKRP